jgi:Na+-driven multidrug efflux pump
VKDYGFLVALGLPSFLRNSSMAVAATIQLSLIVAVATHTSEEQASTYQNIYGATNAIYNLSFTALFGIINGSRIICSYNYGARDFKRVR